MADETVYQDIFSPSLGMADKTVYQDILSPSLGMADETRGEDQTGWSQLRPLFDTSSYILGQIFSFLLKAHCLSKHVTSFETRKVYPYLHVQKIVYEILKVLLTVYRVLSV